MAIFDYQWVDAPPYPDPVAHRTMAKLTIRVGNRFATRVYDRYLKESRDHVVVPLAQVAEWAVANWWRLLHEAGNVPDRQRPGFDAGHDLSHAGFGFALPQLTFRPLGDRIRATAARWQPRHTALEFLEEGDELLGREEFEAGLASLVDAVIQRLRATEVPFPDLEADWRAIRAAEAEDREFCQAAAMAGFDPFDMDDSTADAIARFWNEAPVSLREDALGGSQPDSLDDLLQWLRRRTASLAVAESGREWPRVRQRARRGEEPGPPWQRGYAAARAVRRELAASSGRFSFQKRGDLVIHAEESPSPSPGILGCVAPDSPSCAVSRRHLPAKRFLIARALGDYLGRDEPGPAVLGRLETPRQAHSRAFAAELLAPASWLRSRIGKAQTVDSDALDEIAEELCVSPLVLQHQLRNHRIAEVAPVLAPAS